MRDSGLGELFSKSYSSVAGEGFRGKGDWLIGSSFSIFPIKGFDYAPQMRGYICVSLNK